MYIYEFKDWPEFRWDADALVRPLASVRLKQGKLLGRMEALGFETRSEASLKMLTSEVVKTSAIEGEALSVKDVRSSIARKLGLDVAGLTDPNTRSARDVEGVVQMMLDATREFDAELTSERLFGWHAALFPTGFSGIHRIAVGKWRGDEEQRMRVVSGPIGREHTHFEAPEASTLEAEMRTFLQWFNDVPEEDLVLRAGVAHLWFVTIHPFEDGNGRVARAIADMALARADGCKDRFYSMSTQIEAERADYYRELESAQKGDVNITRWLRWFLQCLERALDSAEVSLEEVFGKAEIWGTINRHALNERQRLVVAKMLDGFEGFLTSSKYSTFAKCSTDTALRDIRELVEWGVLAANAGKGRSVSYRLGINL